MGQMGMAKYCHDINHMNAFRLIEQFEEAIAAHNLSVVSCPWSVARFIIPRKADN